MKEKELKYHVTQEQIEDLKNLKSDFEQELESEFILLNRLKKLDKLQIETKDHEKNV